MMKGRKSAHRGARRMAGAKVLPSLLAAMLASTGASAQECLQADAFYSDRDRVAVIAFDQGYEPAPGVSNQFSMLIGDFVLEGIVMWSAGVERPQAILMHGCPEGDVTGEELDACTLWQGVVYAIDAEGEVDLLPGPTETAADRLLFPALPWQLAFSAEFEAGELEALPWEVFEQTGCSE